MSTLTHKVRQYTVKETAQEIRAALRREFPGVKFSLRMTRGTGYGWMSLSYTDGPVTRAVDSITAGFRSSYFDGMDDSTHQIPSTIYAEADGSLFEPRWSCDGVNSTRDFSPAMLERAAQIACEGSVWWEYCEQDFGPRNVEHYASRRLLQCLDLTHGFPQGSSREILDMWRDEFYRR